MNTNQLKIALIAALTSTIIGFALYFNSQKTLRENKLNLEKKTQAFEDISEINATLLQILEIEERFFEDNDYQKAINAFKDLLLSAGEKETPIISKRLENLELVIESNGANLDELQRFKYQLYNERETIKSLKVEIQEISTKKKQTIDSLQSLYAATQDDLNKAQRQLKSKEKVKVISFDSGKGSKIHYIGEVENGKANGGGIGIWSTGSTYRGNWKDNLRHGKGKFEWLDGVTYEGDYFEDKRQGNGEYKWPSGERYVGEWKSDKRNGEGILYDIDGNISFKGKWVDDKPVR